MTVQQYIRGPGAVNIVQSIEAAVDAGRCPPGTLLPPIRDVAATLDVSPTTVAAAYQTLRLRGIVTAQGRRGTRIANRPAMRFPARQALPAGVRDLSEGNPDARLLPRLQPGLGKLSPEPRLYGGELNFPGLIAFARRRFLADRIPAHDVTVVSGALDGIERVLDVHLRAGDAIAVEDPCFYGILDLLAARGLTPIPVPMDGEGIAPEPLSRALRAGARGLIATPRAQNPTGAAFTRRRGEQLKAVLDRFPEVLLIEDDHAGPIAGAPAITLIDARRARWAVARSVSKFLGPDLRVALIAGDAYTVGRLEGRLAIGIRWVSHVLQELVLMLWSRPDTARLLARAEATYARRRTALMDALSKQGIGSTGGSGLNVWIPVQDESNTVQALLEAGWAVAAGERFRLESAPAIRVTTAALDEQDGRKFAADLARAMAPTHRSLTA